MPGVSQAADIIASTITVITPGAINAALANYPLTAALQRHGAIKKGHLGPKVKQPFKVRRAGVQTPIITGYDKLNYAPTANLDNVEFGWAGWAVTAGIGQNEKDDNTGPSGAVSVDLQVSRWKDALDMDTQAMEQHFTAGDVVALAQAGLNTLYGHADVALYPRMEGILLGEDPEGVLAVSTLGGLTRGVEIDGVKQWANRFRDIGDDWSANGRKLGNELRRDIKLRASMVPGAQRGPVFGLMSESAYNNLDEDFVSIERYTNGAAINAEREVSMWGNTELEASLWMPAGDGTADEEFSTIFLNLDHLYLAVQHQLFQQLEQPWGRVEGTMGHATMARSRMQLVCWSLKSQGVLVDGNTP